MCSSVLLAVLGGLLVGKLILRRRWRHAYGGGPGGCGGRGGCGGGWRRGRGWRWRHGFGDGDHRGFEVGAGGGWDTGVRLASVLGGLELNGRQREEADEVFAQVRDALGAGRFAAWRDLDAALDSAAAEPFDKVGVELSLQHLGEVSEAARKTVVDGLEHLHNILTVEQRDRLRAITRSRAAA